MTYRTAIKVWLNPCEKNSRRIQRAKRILAKKDSLYAGQLTKKASKEESAHWKRRCKCENK